LTHDERPVGLEAQLGDPIKLSAAQFERLSKAFLNEIQAKFI